MRCLGLKNKISIKKSGYKGGEAYRIQFGDVNFYQFLTEIGLHPKKSHTISAIKIPKAYFFDFLRGLFDGDGSFYSYWDPRWKSSFMFYVTFVSASLAHILWLRKMINKNLHVNGHITQDGRKATHQLKYAKTESLKILPKLYRGKNKTYLSRKYLKIQKALGIIRKAFPL